MNISNLSLNKLISLLTLGYLASSACSATAVCELLDTGFVLSGSECSCACALIDMTIKPLDYNLHDCSNGECIQQLKFCLFPSDVSDLSDGNEITRMIIDYTTQKSNNLRSNSVLNKVSSKSKSTDSGNNSSGFTLTNFDQPFKFFQIKSLTDNTTSSEQVLAQRLRQDCMTIYYTDCDLMRCTRVELKSEGSEAKFCGYRDNSLMAASLNAVNQNCLIQVNMQKELLQQYGTQSGVTQNDLDMMFQQDFKCYIGQDDDADGIIDFTQIDDTLTGVEKELNSNKNQLQISSNDANLSKSASFIEVDDIIQDFLDVATQVE